MSTGKFLLFINKTKIFRILVRNPNPVNSTHYSFIMLLFAVKKDFSSSSSNRIQLQVEQGEQSHLPLGGLRGKIHGNLHEVCGGDIWRILIKKNLRATFLLILWLSNKTFEKAFKSR